MLAIEVDMVAEMLIVHSFEVVVHLDCDKLEYLGRGAL